MSRLLIRGPQRSATQARHRGRGGAAIFGSHGSASLVGLTAGACVAALSMVAGSIVLAGRAGGEQECAGQEQHLSVLAAPEIGAAVRAAGEALDQRTGSCLLVTVTERSPADAVPVLTARAAKRPHVWIPDSSIWTRPVAGAGVTLPASHPSVALSPVVFALPGRVAQRLGWPDRRIGVDRLLGVAQAVAQPAAQPAARPAGRDAVGGRPVRLGLPDPRRSAATVGGLLAVERAVSGRPGGRGALAEAVRSAKTGLPPDAPALLGALAGDVPLAVPVSEQAVLAHNARPGAPRAVAAYPGTGGMALDYPFVVLGPGVAERKAAARLLTVMRADPGAERLRAAGFRTPRGSTSPATRVAPGFVPAARDVDRAVRTLRLIQLRSRLLAVIDVSGSMGEPVTRGGRTRLDLTRDAAALGLAAYPDDAEVGLWVFSTNLTAVGDHRQLVPVGPLGVRRDGQTGRSLLVRALGGMRHVPNGGTGLYDTTLAAVRAVRAGWNPDRVNAVLLLTDGRNEDRGSITLARLLDTLRRERQPDRPVPVISIAYGPGSDAAALGAISRVTGGTRYVAKEPREIQQVLFDAVGRRPCRPRC